MQRIATLFVVLCVFRCAALHAAQLQVMVKDRNGKPVAEAVVLAVPSDPKQLLHGQHQTDSVDQVNKQFLPYVKVVFVGSMIRFPNSDKVRHQVYSFSDPKRFELPLYAGAEAPPVLFDKPGVVVLGCNIHDWMIGYVYVADTPFFAKTGATGSAVLEDLPRGDYLVRVWQPSMDGGEESTVQRLSILTGSSNHAEWILKLKPNIGIPRVSSGSSAAYP